MTTLTQQLNAVRDIRKFMNDMNPGSRDWYIVAAKCLNLLLADLELRLQQEIDADVNRTNRH